MLTTMIGRYGTHGMLCAVASASLLVGVLGCGGRPAVTLHQPFAAPCQRNLTLHTETSVYAVSGGRQACLLRFPLPGALDGPDAYVIYLTGPAEAGMMPVDANRSAGVHGFFIQNAGTLAGRSDLASGSVRYRSRRGGLDVELDITCADKTHIRGIVHLRPDQRAIRAFERAHATDVSHLLHDAADNTTPDSRYSRD